MEVYSASRNLDLFEENHDKITVVSTSIHIRAHLSSCNVPQAAVDHDFRCFDDVVSLSMYLYTALNSVVTLCTVVCILTDFMRHK